jgi:GTP-binding protein EngB required for normal cell division
MLSIVQHLIYDTHQLMQRLLVRGYTQAQAEGMIEAMHAIDFSSFATKTDLTLAKTELQTEIGGLLNKMDKIEASLRGDMEKMEARLNGDTKDLRAEVKQLAIGLRAEMKQVEQRATIRMGTMMFMLGTYLSAIKFWMPG